MAEPIAHDGTAILHDERALPITIYLLYMGFVTAPLGVLIAYVLKDGAGQRALSHYIFQIRTFWISFCFALVALLIAALGLPLLLFLVGLKLLTFAAAMLGAIGIWVVARGVAGLIYIGRGQSYPRPRTWLI